MIFEVMPHDANDKPVRCSYCERGAENVVVVALTKKPGIQTSLVPTAGDELWLGLWACCVLDMAKAPQAAREAKP